jgi:RNA polymerase-associated protein LEO1
MSDSEDAVDLVNQGEDALFGDEEDDVANSIQGNVLSDKDLESVQEEDNDVGVEYGTEDAEDGHQHRVIMGLQVYRHRTPKTKDGTVRNGC